MSRETHGKLFDILFPLDVLHSFGNEFVVVLRYSPSFEHNEQITIVGREGKVHVVESVSGGNLWYKGNEIFEQTKRDDPVEIANLIGVKKREFDVPFAKVRAWRKGLLNGVVLALAPKGAETPAQPLSESIILDGTIYDVWDKSTSGELHYSMYWGEVSDRIYPGDPVFVQWMKVVRREIAKRQ